ncbi:hypothetical protein GCM10009414_05180 [Tatumella terrea]|uniref:DUF6216 family protein n=1 Tax=Tatumella terrea TaxID=419007 RepID=UPI0031D9821E
MEFDKVNAFLATAIGSLIFKWLAGGVSSLISWLNKTYPEEDFLVSKLGISTFMIRISHCKYKLSTKPYTKSNKITLMIFGTLVVTSSLIGFYKFTDLIIKEPITWLSITLKETRDSFWIKPENAENKPGEIKWSITPETCLNKSEINKISSIKEGTKEFICGYMLSNDKKAELSKESSKNTFYLLIVIPIFLLAIFSFFMLGVGMFIDLYINKKITDFHKSEIEKSYQYLT